MWLGFLELAGLTVFGSFVWGWCNIVLVWVLWFLVCFGVSVLRWGFGLYFACLVISVIAGLLVWVGGFGCCLTFGSITIGLVLGLAGCVL